MLWVLTYYVISSAFVLEIEKKIPELKDEAIRIKEQMLCMKEQETELEGLAVLDIFDKEKLATLIDRVLVYSEERIEIIWKMNDPFFKEMAGEKEVFTLQ